MRDYMNPPQPRGATPREQSVIDQTHRIACMVTDKRHIGPLRDAVELIIELIEDRGKRRDDGAYDDPSEDF